MRYSFVVLAALLMLASGHILAQHTGGPPGSPTGPTEPEGKVGGYMSQDNVKDLADFVDATRRLEAKDLASKGLATKRAAVMIKALQLTCDLTDARQAASGKTTVGGKQVSVGLYEIACVNGMGYLLTLLDLSSASGISCFAAMAAQSSGSGGDAANLQCSLPANSNLNIMAGNVLKNAGTACDPNHVKWLGQSAPPKLDYTEVGCNDSKGLILRTPTPGNAGKIDVLSCEEAASHGARCQLTVVASTAAAALPSTPTSDARPTLEWFKQALTKNGVQCDVKNGRMIGRESIKRRYIAEFQCAGRPQGLVAIIPTDGDSTNRFEQMDCAAAAAQKIICKFVDAH